MIVDMPGRGLVEHADAAIVLYYAFSIVAEFDALNAALERFKASGKRASLEKLESFMGYADFAERARKYR